MKHLKKSLYVVVAVGLLGVMFASFGAKQVHAAIAALVHVANTPDSPVPVRDTHVTTSFSVLLPQGVASKSASPPIPACPMGTEFLISSVNAAPDFFVNPNIQQLGAWGVRVNVLQKSGGGEISRPILAYGNGPQNVSATLPAGQPTFFDAAPDVFVATLSGPSPAQFEFIIHVSGYCGVAFVSP